MNTNTLSQTMKQPLADLLKANYPNLNETALADVAYIGYIAGEQGGYQQARCESIYQQLRNWEFKATTENLDAFTQLFADLVGITIENLHIINYGTLDNSYYREDFFSTLEAALPLSKEATQVVDDLVAKFGRGWKTPPQKKNPLAEGTTQQLANALQTSYKAYNLRSNADKQTLIESWRKLVILGKIFYPNQPHEYDIHYQQFESYANRAYSAQYSHLAAFCYSVARMVQLATHNLAQAKYDPDFCPFLAAIEATWGHEVADAFLN